MSKDNTQKPPEKIPIEGVVPGETQYVSTPRETEQLYDEMRRLRIEASIQPAVMKCRRVIKTVDILNAKGDAKISVFFDCINGRDKLQRIRHRIEHDGMPLSEKDISLRVNTERLDPEIESYAYRKIPGGKSPPFENVSILYVNFKHPVNEFGAFSYEYSYSLRKVYPKLATLESTSYSVMHPTDLLEFSLRSPLGFRYDRDSLGVEIIQYNGLPDTREKGRIVQMFSPILLRNESEILYTIKNPKITYTYTISFRLVAITNL